MSHLRSRPFGSRPPFGSREGPTLLLVVIACLAAACRRSTDDQERAAPAVASLPAPAPAPPAPPPWYAGAWQGRVEWTSGAPREGAGLPREWLEDAGPLDGADLTLRVDESREVDGRLTGSFSLTVRGRMDDDALRAELEPDLRGTQEPAGPVFRGTLVATRHEPEKPAVLVGTLRLSSGDSLLVRHAKVSLERASESPAAAPP